MRAPSDQPPSKETQTLDLALRPLDEVLLLVLKIQPSEIAELDMDDYWHWIDAAEREIKRRVDATKQS
ncbi:hypothetical protein A8E62_25555 [Burkholderia cenocepacia]|uniref:GpE family phage tail protein n=1 Tax=Burkholderia cenocepacia TaxID=95486 RepID=A0A1V2VWW9_9BURK|nr:hypothetical protein A8E66_03535 [Burkholderia cenocepacia]ONU49954.1 hypothetical protein A8E67_38885 [Burkholderia cenocepacia]ONU51603.1 hypothetical protein A8E62_25555 [Burkholderia cenocepacia]ONU53329.1 hypothetical protein A8E68_36445 [Burkholderia cenocepacia]ONU77462.1 hypothetical protein A8E72_31865 [Burkholderia cenocepacia]